MRYATPAAVMTLFVVSLAIAPAHAAASPNKPAPTIRQARQSAHSPTPPPTPSPARPSGAPLGSSIHPSTSGSTSGSTSAAGAATNTLSQYAEDAKPYHSPNSYPWGQCTWGAAALAHDNVDHLGDAEDWLANAQARGLPTGLAPRAGATVVFQPGVQGASYLGHVAHVIAVYPDGSFRVEELNFYGYGGGLGVWSTRVAHTGWGVSFIY